MIVRDVTLSHEREAAISGISQLLQAGRLRHTIASRWLLEDIAAAHEAVEQGKAIGNVVVDLTG